MAESAVQLTYDLIPSPQMQSKLQRQMVDLERSLRLKGPFNGMASDATKFSRELDRATSRVITLGTAFSVLSTAGRVFNQIVKDTVAVEKAMTDVNAVLKLTDQSLASFTARLFDVSRETARSFADVAKAAQEFARQGLSVAKTQEAVRASLILSRDANIDVLESVKALTAATNSFSKEGLSYAQIVNKLAVADSAFAVSSQDLQEALTRVGSAASDAGVSFDQLIGLVTSAQQITARGGSVIAGALNTIFTRINRKDTLDALDNLGVVVTDTQGRMLPTIQVLSNFAKAYDGMTGSIKNQAAELVGGVRQLNTLKAVLDDLARTNGVFAQSTEMVSKAQDEAYRRNETRNASLSARAQQLRNTGSQIGSNIGNIGFGQTAKEVLSAFTNNPITDALRDAGDPTKNGEFGAEAGKAFIKGFGGAVTYGLLPLLTVILGKVSTAVFNNLAGDIKGLVLVRGETAERANIENQIVDLYKQGGTALQQQLATMTSLTERAAYLQSLLRGAGSDRTSVRAMTNQIVQMGGIRRAAEGYVPMAEEAAAISRGVGGAPSSAVPVYLPGFNRGGGQMGIVANSSEFKVPGAAGGAIYNRDMIRKYGLPPGSTPVAAGGYVPNAAEGNGRLRSAVEIALGGSANAPKTAYQAALQSFVTTEKEAEEIVKATLGSLGQSIKKAAAVFQANASIGEFGSVIPYGPPAPTQKQWKFLEEPSKKRAADFEKAKKELDKQAALDQKLTELKEKQLAQMNAFLDRQDAANKKSLTLTEMRLADSTAGASNRQNIERIARAEKEWQYALQAATAKFSDNGASFETISSYLRNRQQNAGYGREYDEQLKRRPGASLPQATAGTSVFERYGPYGPNPPMNRDTYRREIVEARQQYIEGAFKRTDRQSQIIAQNERLAKLQERLKAARKWDSRAPDGPYGPFLPEGWTPAPTGFAKIRSDFRNLGSRIASNPYTGLALGIGLPAIGSNIDQGVGGTNSGIVRGAASAAFNTAGMGASVGSIAGPQGALIGAGVGGLLGGIYGAVGKAMKSLEEFSAELDQGTKALAEESNALISIFRLQSEIKEARASGKTDQVKDLVAEQSSLVANIRSKKYLDLISSSINDPNAIEKVTKETSANSKERDRTTRLLEGFFSIRSTSANETADLFGLNTDRDSRRKSAISGVSSVLGQMSPEEVGQIRKSLANRVGADGSVRGPSPTDALRIIGKKANLTPEQQKELEERASEYAGDVILDAIRAITGNSTKATAHKGVATPPAFSKDDIRYMLNQMQIRSEFANIDSDVNQKIRDARQQISLSNPALSEMGKLQLQGAYGLSNIADASESSRNNLITKGRESLISALDSGGIRDKATINSIKSQITDLASARNLQRQIQGNEKGTENFRTLDGSFGVALQNLINALETLEKTESANFQVAKAINDGLKEQLLFVRSMRGAQAEDEGEENRILDGMKAAAARGDAADVTDPLGKASRINQLRKQFRIDNRQDRFDAGIQVGDIADRLRDLGRTNRANALSQDTRVGLGFDLESAGLTQRVDENQTSLRIATLLGDTEKIRDLTLEQKMLETERLRLLDRISDREKKIRDSVASENSDLDRIVEQNKVLLETTRQTKAISGSRVESSALANASILGRKDGDSMGSFVGGFRARFAGLKQDINDLSEVGNRVAQSLESNLGNSFADFVTGAKRGKDAFRDFVTSVLSDASRMLASKSVASALSFIPGFGAPAGATGGEFDGKAFKFAAGGMVPAMLTGGEYYIGPKAAKKIGYDTLRNLNGYTGYADGGVVRGGSGVRDDVPARIPPGSFIIKKSATQKLGADYLDSLVSGKVQHRFFGGVLAGALIGGGIGYLTGGKKGAIGGALIGGIGGAMYSQSVANAAGASVGAAPSTFSNAAKLTMGLGASTGLGLIAAGISDKGVTPESSYIGLDQVPALRAKMEAEQNESLSARGGKSTFLALNPQGGYSLAGYDSAPATRRWGWSEGGTVDFSPIQRFAEGGEVDFQPMQRFSDGGGVSVPLTMGGGSSSYGSEPAQVSVKIEINNNGTTTSSASSSGGDGAFGTDFAGKIEKQVRGIVQDELVQQSRADGFFSQRSRYRS